MKLKKKAKIEYKVTDAILPMLQLPKKVKISIEIDEENNSVSLQVGPRDWSWDKTNGEMYGCGTTIGKP